MTPEEAFDLHHQAVFSFVYRLTRKADIAEDVTQDCFLAYVRAPERFDAERGASLKTYLIAIARNLALKHIRDYGREDQMDEDAVTISVESGKTLDIATAVESAVATLAPLQQEALVLFEYEGFTLRRLQRRSSTTWRSRTSQQQIPSTDRASRLCPSQLAAYNRLCGANGDVRSRLCPATPGNLGAPSGVEGSLSRLFCDAARSSRWPAADRGTRRRPGLLSRVLSRVDFHRRHLHPLGGCGLRRLPHAVPRGERRRGRDAGRHPSSAQAARFSGRGVANPPPRRPPGGDRTVDHASLLHSLSLLSPRRLRALDRYRRAIPLHRQAGIRRQRRHPLPVSAEGANPSRRGSQASPLRTISGARLPGDAGLQTATQCSCGVHLHGGTVGTNRRPARPPGEHPSFTGLGESSEA